MTEPQRFEVEKQLASPDLMAKPVCVCQYYAFSPNLTRQGHDCEIYEYRFIVTLLRYCFLSHKSFAGMNVCATNERNNEFFKILEIMYETPNVCTYIMFHQNDSINVRFESLRIISTRWKLLRFHNFVVRLFDVYHLGKKRDNCNNTVCSETIELFAPILANI